MRDRGRRELPVTGPPMIRWVLVPLDGSALSEHAVTTAVEIARRTHATLGLALVEEGSAPPQRSDQSVYLRSVARLGSGAGVPVTTTLLSGPVVEALVTRAQAMGADLIVMTTHGRSGLSRLLFGSVAEGVVRRASIPVLLVRPPAPDRDPGPPPPRFARVLIPLDGTPFSEAILEPASEVFGTEGVEYVLLRVISRQLDEPAVAGLGSVASALLEETSRQVEHARDYLARVAERLRSRGASVRCALPVQGDATSAIVQYADEAAVGVIAMATHSREGLERLALGSVAAQVLSDTAAAVLLYRPRDP